MASAKTLPTGLVRQFSNIIDRGQMSQAYIFAGAAGAGKSALAQWIAKRLFCTNLQNGQPCNTCGECLRIDTGNNPDVLTVAPDGQSIKAEAIRGLKEEMGKSSVEGHRRIFIIQDADRMTVSAANSLLKFFEEPLPGMLIILTTTAKNRLLPTVLSRAQIVQFPPPVWQSVADQLVNVGVQKSLATVIAHLTSDVEAGSAMAADEEFQSRVSCVLRLIGLLASSDGLAFPFIQTDLMKQVSDKNDQRQVLRLLAVLYAEALQRSTGAQPQILPNDAGLGKLAEQSTNQLTNGLDAILTATVQLEGNVGFQADCEQLVLKLLRRAPQSMN